MSSTFSKLTSLVIFSCLFLGLNAQKYMGLQGFEKMPKSTDAYSIHEHARINTSTKQPVTLYGLSIPVQGNSPEEMAKYYLSNFAKTLHLDREDLSDLKHKVTRTTLGGHVVRFTQHHHGVQVHGGEIAVTIDFNNKVTYVANGYLPNVQNIALVPSLSVDQAKELALGYLDIDGPVRYIFNSQRLHLVESNTHLAHRIVVNAIQPLGEWEVFVDGTTGEILQSSNIAHYCNQCKSDAKKQKKYVPFHPPMLMPKTGFLIDGIGNAFVPDPLSSAMVNYGTGGYTDNNDANSADLTAQQISVTLLDISFDGTNYKLEGPFAEVVDFEDPFFGLFEQPNQDFSYDRADSEFEAVNCYYHLDGALRYINNTLNIPLMPYQYNGGIRFDPHALSGADNSYFSSTTGQLAFGEGCVDDAEDSDVVHHELGHGLHDWVTSGGLSQTDGLSEGCGDYWAQSYNRGLGNWGPGDPQYQWVFNWDGHNACWNGRITDYAASYPGGLVGQIHTDGQIWATCLMEIWDNIGQQNCDAMFLTGLGSTNGSSSQNDAANACYQAAISMGFSSGDIVFIHQGFTSCGYTLPPLSTPPTASFTSDLQVVCIDEGFNVVFTDLSSGATGWNWSFPGGAPATSTMQNPTIAYTAVGDYDVELIVQNSAGNDTINLTNFISVVSGVDCPNCSSTNIVQNTTCDPAQAGTSTDTLTTAQGCDSIIITSTTLITNLPVFTGTTNPDCNGTSTGTATVNNPGNLTYLWSTAQITQTATGLPAGTHTVTITDDLGCTGVGTVIIIDPPLLVSNLSVDNGDCVNGTILDAAPSGGTPPLNYIWSTGEVTQTIGAPMPDTYDVTITDSKGCTTQSSVTLATVNTGGPDISYSSDNVSCFGDSDGAINLELDGGTPPFTYAWSSGSTLEDIFNLAPGSYTVLVTDANNCLAATSVTISQPAFLFATTLTSPSSNNSDGSATAIPNGGTPPYQYVWSTGQTEQIATNLNVGSYDVTIIDANGCNSTSTATVELFTGTQDLDEVMSLSIYPNPTNGVLYLDIAGTYTGQLDLTVFDVTGKVMMNVASLEMTKNRLDVSALPNGTYYMSIQNEEGQQTIKKLVVVE